MFWIWVSILLYAAFSIAINFWPGEERCKIYLRRIVDFINFNPRNTVPVMVAVWHFLRSGMTFTLLRILVRSYIVDTFHLGSLNTKDGSAHLTYHNGDTRYRIVYPIKRGPRAWTNVHNHFGEDVTGCVSEYAGPHNNFHGFAITPKNMGFEALTFTMRDGTTTRRFNTDDPISF